MSTKSFDLYTAVPVDPDHELLRLDRYIIEAYFYALQSTVVSIKDYFLLRTYLKNNNLQYQSSFHDVFEENFIPLPANCVLFTSCSSPNGSFSLTEIIRYNYSNITFPISSINHLEFILAASI